MAAHIGLLSRAAEKKRHQRADARHLGGAVMAMALREIYHHAINHILNTSLSGEAAA